MDECFEADIEKELGNAAYRYRDFERAIFHYLKASSINPRNMIYRNNIAAAFFEQGQFKKCIEECEAALTIGRSDGADIRHIAKAYSRMAHAYYRLSDFNTSYNCYKLSLKEAYDDGVFKKIQELEQFLNRQVMTKINPLLSAKHKAEGDEQFEKGEFPEALACYTEAINNNPKDPTLFSNRSECYAKLLEFKAAAADCDSCLALDSSCIKAFLRKGSCMFALRKYKKAEEAYMAALELDSNNKEAFNGFKKCVTNSHVGPEVIRREAMRDPEIRSILEDPFMREILDNAQTQPHVINRNLARLKNQGGTEAQEHAHSIKIKEIKCLLRNPEFASKVEKLVQSGLLAIT